MVGRDGGVFAFGDAPFHGSLGSVRLVAPDRRAWMSRRRRSGYVMLGADGGVFVFGAVPFFGFASRVAPVASPRSTSRCVRTATATGSLLADGRVFAFGDAPALGSTPRLAAADRRDRSRARRRRLPAHRPPTAACSRSAARSSTARPRARASRRRSSTSRSTASGDGYWMLGRRRRRVQRSPAPGLPPGGTPHLTVTPVAQRARASRGTSDSCPTARCCSPNAPGTLQRARRRRAARARRARTTCASAARAGCSVSRSIPTSRTTGAIYTCFNTDRRRREGRRVDARRRQ